MSARLPPEDERWKIGCDGRPGASDMRDPDVERAWFAVPGAWEKLFWEEDRFMAEAGIGMAETL